MLSSTPEEPEDQMLSEAPVATLEVECRTPLHLVAVPTVDPIGDLTPREREVLALMADGRSNHAICCELFISPKTLERHVQHVFTKLGLPPDSADHRRVRAVLAWLRSPRGGLDA